MEKKKTGGGIDQDINSTRVMRNVLDAERPDSVVINGDSITGENTFKENSTEYVDHIVKPLVERNIPWASIYGNHDSKFNLSREALFVKERYYALSYIRRMNSSLRGITNYYLLFYDDVSAGNFRLIAVLWFFDSGGGASYQQ
ncbi:putative Calcineurin-like phosphoesterase [Seiridium cardinale]